MQTASPSSPRASLSLTWAMGLFLLVNAFAINGALWLASPQPYKETVLKHSWDVVTARGCDDSWGIMTVAYEYAMAPHTTPIYTEVFFNRKLKFQYPPSSLFIIGAMLKIAGREQFRTEECKVYDTPPINDILGWMFILLIVVSATAVLEVWLRRKHGIRSAWSMIAARGVLVAGFTLTFYPVVKAFTLGQIQLWINAAFTMSLLAWVLGHKAASGVLIGFMCLIKPHYGAFLLWGLLRREWRFALGLAGMVVVGIGASLLVFGWADNVDYMKVFWFLSQRGEAFFPNQSVNGLLNRVMSLADPVAYKNIVFDDNGFPPFTPLVYGGALVAALLLVGTALFRRGIGGDSDRTLDYATMALSITMASTIAWEHHYGVVFPIFALVLANSLGNRARLIWLGVAYVLISNFIPVTNLLAATPANIVQSYLFAGAIILLVLLHRSRTGWRMSASAAAAPVAAMPATVKAT